MNKSEMRHHVEYLAGDLPHRAANTECERSAAAYLSERLTECTPDVETDRFSSPGSVWVLYALYYIEFLFVAVMAWWWPWPFFAYGVAVLLAYLAEFSGYCIFARFLPHYETQNVVARFLADRPERLVIVIANYDSSRESPLTRHTTGPWLRGLHTGVVTAMVLVLASCAAQGFDVFDLAPFRADLLIRVLATGYLILAGAALLYNEDASEWNKGAADNASGVAVLLGLARRIQQEPLHTTDVWLAATGSSETGLHGVRRLISTHELDRDNTYFINVERVGFGNVAYTKREGLLSGFRSAPELVALAERAGGAAPCALRGLPGDALIPLSRGFKTITVTALPTEWTHPSMLENCDRPGAIDYDTLSRAGDLVERLLRDLDTVS